MYSGKNPNISVQEPPTWGNGADAYIAQIEVFHQIHCLNELRKEIYYDYYYPDAGPPDALHIDHKNHCIHIILQNLMCNSDVGIITHNWVHNERIQEPKTRPFPDFNTIKKCRDFDRLLEWANEHGQRGLSKKFNQLRVPEGMTIVSGDGYA